ncbi:hypothetical protein CEE44_02620 [Candidatus Woesearchaeota archaeon B3_Woes]|nr:MAG: hypothetical protein CEE44_02620 [Candidatus Woesearchaeota archaeon B3_Woes]
MIAQKNFLSKLRDFGLNTYESKLWTALLSRGVSTAGELSNIANVPRSRTYDVLESLEKKGFIILNVGKPIKYLAVPPEEVVERVKKKVKEESDTKTILLEELKNSTILEELNIIHKQGSSEIEPSDLVGYFKGKKTIYNNIELMIREAKTSVLLMTNEEGIKTQKHILLDVLSKNKDKKIDVKIAAPITKENIKEAKELSRFAEIRNTKNKSRFCIIDGEKIIFMLLDDTNLDPNYDCAVWAESKPFLTSLRDLFESNWPNLEPLNKIKI